MSATVSIVLAVLALGLLYVAVQFLSGYLKFRGKRVITCPETRAPAGVELAAGKAAVAAMAGETSFRLRDCTRWPERAGCGQECLSQIEASPEDCLVRNILGRWYLEKSCALCGKPLGTIDWTRHRPCLLTPERKTVEWKDVPPETLQEVLETHAPVCWDCHIAETFRREHPELVTDRNWNRR